jgi:putative hydrolase of the HAD superfamily
MANSNNHKGSKTSPIRAVVLDYGEVLSLPPEPKTMGRMAAAFQMEPGLFFERYIPTRGPYDQGLLTAEEYWLGFARELGVGVDAERIEKLRAWDTQMWSRTNPVMTAWLEELQAAGLTTALLSNMQFDMAAHARKYFAWLTRFDHQILSCELRLIKPDAAIFRETIQRLGVRPQETLFVDDREANVEAARAAGMRAVRFQSTDRLRAALQEIGFEILPGEK